MRLAFVIPSLGTGGAERVASLLCNWWAEQGHEVTVFTFDNPEAEHAFFFSEGVSIRPIAAYNKRRSIASSIETNIRRVTRLRAEFKQLEPDVIVAFMTEANVPTLCAAVGLGIPVVVSERNQPERPGLGTWRKIARRLSYPAAAALVMQTEDIAEWARKHLRVPVVVIPNPVNPAFQATCSADIKLKRIVAIGRLVHQKGFDVLISSFARIAGSYPEWDLIIYGEGPERAALEAQVRELSMSGRIALPGVLRDIRAAYMSAAIFVLPSRYEGYPNVLLEALASGCAVVATDCPGATAEILQGGRLGVLVQSPEVEALATALAHLMPNEAQRAAYSKAAVEAIAALDLPTVGGRWLDLFERLIGSEPSMR